MTHRRYTRNRPYQPIVVVQQPAPQPAPVITPPAPRVKPPRRTWRRVAISVFGIAIIVFIWRWSIAHLYTLPEHSISAFSSLTTSAFYVIGVIVVFLVTGLTFFSWTQASNLSASVSDLIQGFTGQNQPPPQGDNEPGGTEPPPDKENAPKYHE